MNTRVTLQFQSLSTRKQCCVFAEWAAGVSAALDVDTVNKHIAAMVDVSVEENYQLTAC